MSRNEDHSAANPKSLSQFQTGLCEGDFILSIFNSDELICQLYLYQIERKTIQTLKKGNVNILKKLMKVSVNTFIGLVSHYKYIFQ